MEGMWFRKQIRYLEILLCKPHIRVLEPDKDGLITAQVVMVQCHTSEILEFRVLQKIYRR